MNKGVSMINSMGYLFWGFLIVYGIVMMILSPKHVTTDGFFHGKSSEGHEPSQAVLMLSIFISWIFAKSVTNAANLGAEYGCNYPPDVDEGTVARSNVIHSSMKKNLKEKEILKELEQREKTAAITAMGVRIAITHGDEKSMFGWECARDALQKEERREELDIWLRENQIDILATTHTCLPAITAIGDSVVSNNSSTGMANVRGKTYGLITRIAKSPHPKAVATKRVKDVYVELVKVEFPIEKFVEFFDNRWPECSPASVSYRDRIMEGTAVEEEAVDIDKGFKDSGLCS